MFLKVKIGTGFDKKGATIHDIELINKHKGDVLEIKASGGIKNSSDAIKFIEAGATRIGTSHAVEIINNIDVDDECCCGHCHKEDK